MISNVTTIIQPPTTGVYDYNTWNKNVSTFPAVGESYTDSTFTTEILRLTNRNALAGDEQYTHHWANADGSYIFNPTGGLKIIDRTGAVQHSSQPTGSFLKEIAWHPTDPDKYYYLGAASVVSRSLSSQTNTTTKTFAATLIDRGGSDDWISADGRYFFVAYVSSTVSSGFIWDSSTDTLYSGSVNIASGNHWGLTANGSYLIAFDNPGHSSYAINHATSTLTTTGVMFWDQGGDHGTTVCASDGETYGLVLNSNGGTFMASNGPGIYAVNVTTNNVGKTLAQQIATALHSSCLMPSQWGSGIHASAPHIGSFVDWCFYSQESPADGFDEAVGASDNTPQDPSDNWYSYKQEINAVNIFTQEIRRFCHHRGRGWNVNYWNQPRVSCSWDGSIVFWDSNFNVSSPAGYSDIYAILNPLGSAVTSVIRGHLMGLG